MFAVTASRMASRLQAIQSARNMSVISGPPQTKISGAEKVAHGIFLSVGILAIPLWVLANIKHYRANSTAEE